MRSRFAFPPIDFFRPLQPQLLNRAQWVGWGLQEHDTAKGHRWALIRSRGKGDVEVRTFDTLCEIDIELNRLLEQLADDLAKTVRTPKAAA